MCGNTVTKQTWTVEQRFSAFDELRAGLRVVLQDTDADALRTLNGCFPPKLPFSRALGLSLTHSAKEERQQAQSEAAKKQLTIEAAVGCMKNYCPGLTKSRIKHVEVEA